MPCDGDAHPESAQPVGRGCPRHAEVLCNGRQNALLEFTQEHRAHHAMEALRELAPVVTTVLRQGQSRVQPAEAVVPGDILVLYEGCVIPADVRVIESSSLNVVEAVLTGESDGNA